jgi:hypothetical protein
MLFPIWTMLRGNSIILSENKILQISEYWHLNDSISSNSLRLVSCITIMLGYIPPIVLLYRLTNYI